jgi:hypothetical protein
MDAATLYIIARLANGEAHLALKEPLRGRTCERAKLESDADTVLHKLNWERAKLIALFCTDASGRRASSAGD